MSAASSPLLLRRSLSLAPQQQPHQHLHIHQRFGKPRQTLRQSSTNSGGSSGNPNGGNMSREQLAQRLRHNWAVRDTQVQQQQQQQTAAAVMAVAVNHDALFSTTAVGKLAAAAAAAVAGTGGSGGMDTDLTNLGWLQNMNLMKLTPPTPPASPQPPSAAAVAAAAAAADAAAAASAAASAAAVLGSEVILVEQTVTDSLQFYSQLTHQQQQQQNHHHSGALQHQQSYMAGSGNSRPYLHRTISTPAFQPSNGGSAYGNHSLITSQHSQQQQQQQQQQQSSSLIQLPPSAPPIPPRPDPEYAADPNLRPPYSFSTLIYMALKSLSKSKMTLQEICEWIVAHFAFYGSSADQSWQSAVRYNLTLNRCFQRVPRRKDEAASRGGSAGAGTCGGYWRLNPDYIAQLELANAQYPHFQQQQPYHQAPPSSGSMKRQRCTQQQQQLPPLHYLDSPLGDFHPNRRHHSYHHMDEKSPLLSDQPAAAKLRRIYEDHSLADGRSVNADRHDSSGHWVSMALSGGPVETRVRDPTLMTQPAAAAAAVAAATAVSVAATTAAAAAATGAASTLTASSTNASAKASGAAGEAAGATAEANGSAESVALPAQIVGVGELNEDERWLFEPDEDGVLEDPAPALDMSNPESLLDLTLHGMALPPPNWWLANGSSGITEQQLQQHAGSLNGSLNGLMIGLPSTPSPIMQHEQDEWVDENLGAVGSLDNLLGI